MRVMATGTTPGTGAPHKVPDATSDVCIPILTTADGAGLNGSNPSISVNSIEVAEGGSLILGSGTVSIATALINNGFITLFGTTLSAASIDRPNPGEIDVYDSSSITSRVLEHHRHRVGWRHGDAATCGQPGPATKRKLERRQLTRLACRCAGTAERHLTNYDAAGRGL
jgi:hypothetical protein